MSSNYVDRAKKAIDDITEAGLLRTHKLEELREVQNYLEQKRKELRRGD